MSLYFEDGDKHLQYIAIDGAIIKKRWTLE